MGVSGEVPAAAAAYAAALREVVDGFLAVGGTQKKLADALHISPAALSRYLSGDRTAPYGFLRDLRAFLEERDLLWDEETGELLDALCGQAHAASGSPAVQLIQIREELTRLRGEQQEAKAIAETRLAVLEAQARELTGQLAQALDRARTAEGARTLLEAQVREQDESLHHAQDYIREVEAELSEQREQARLLQLEVGVLRKQNQQLVEDQDRTVSGVSTQATSFEATLAARAARQATEAAAPTQQRRGQTASKDEILKPLASFPRLDTPTPTRPKPTGKPQNPHRPQPPAPEPTRPIRPGRDTLAFLALAAPVWLAGAAFAAGIRADPGPSVWKLIIAAVVALLATAIGCSGHLIVLEKYYSSRFVGVALQLIYTTPVVLIAGISVPLLSHTDDPVSHWLADVVGLL
ncbi:helix-turn-helix domain-containing protein [Streptomyces microflavus]|uniref:helix-turn-helix domain-containing protein n=1 Tax=Streptomyces TaxID=1883 RepID=UPI0029B1CB03|nr:helix-turn-helix domain-containing protein [Streptomyces sp. NRRL_B-2249]MDX2982209.1 helix-turn-helix domain-containing protein [Streptomyces sp. NRRL_B-2249]